MIEVHYIMHIDDMYRGMLYYYMDISPTELFNHFNSKGKVKYWANGRLVLSTSNDYEIILEIREIKTIGLKELSDRIGV